VITTLNTGSSELVNKFNCGFVVEAMNSDKILEKFYELVDNKNLLKIFSENALKASSVTWESFVSSLNGILSKYR
jgi:glycosyltransferase involved in cell wall biosynthesis